MGARWEPVGPEFSLKSQPGHFLRAGLGHRTKVCVGEPCARAGGCAMWTGGQWASDRVTKPVLFFSCRDSDRHVKVKQRGSVLNMLRRLDKIRFRGHKRDDFLDLAESPNASDTECGDEVPLKIPRTSTRDSEELRDPVSMPCGPQQRECPPPLFGLSPGWARDHPPSSDGQAEPCPAWSGFPSVLVLLPTGPHWQVFVPLIEDHRALPLPRVCPATGFLFLPHWLPGWLANFSWGSHAQSPRQLAEAGLGPHRAMWRQSWPLWAGLQGSL